VLKVFSPKIQLIQAEELICIKNSHQKCQSRHLHSK